MPVVTTCTWNFRRHAAAVVAATCVAGITFGMAPGHASADQISTLKAQATALAARIQTLGRQEDALAQQYDAAQLAVQSTQAKVAQAAQNVAAANASAEKAHQALQKEAIDAYVRGGANALTAGAGTTMASANTRLLGAEYANSLATNQADAIDEYHLASLQQQAAKVNLRRQEQVAQVGLDRQQVSATQTQLQGALNQDNGRIATLVAQAQAAAEAAAAAQARARLLAAQEAAAAQAAAAQAAAAQAAAAQAAAQSAVAARTLSGFVAAPSNPPPPVGAGAAGAVAAAKTRLGDPYVWGAAGPDAFDCSGLVMWAYAQVGISLPHFSGAQYADTTHISMADLQPGDLVFPADPSQHVAMYIGGGQIIEAPFTGSVVHIVALSSWFVLASRVA